MARSIKLNLANLIVTNAEQHPDAIALSLGASPHASYKQLLARMRSIRDHLICDRGLRPGDRVALAMRNSPTFWEVLFGAWHAGMIVVPVNYKLHPLEIEYILQHSDAVLCFATHDVAAGLHSTNVPILDSDAPIYQQILCTQPGETVPHPSKPEDPAWLFYTSGTTGRPKGAILSHHNLMMMVLAHLVDIDDLGTQDCILHAAPQSHGSGLLGLVHFAVGANNITPQSGGFDPMEIASLLDHFSGMTLFAAPTMLNRMVKEPAFTPRRIKSLRSIVYGGAPMYLADLERAIDVFGPCLVQIYGQGESPMTITSLGKDFHQRNSGQTHSKALSSVGRARWGVEVRITGANGHKLPAGEIGEVEVRGEVVMSGYWQDAKTTAQSLRTGWLRTGDVGMLDEAGLLTLLDRSKDLIISGGSNIYPREIEEVLLRHPAIAEVSVIGRPDAEWGEIVMAFVVSAVAHQGPTDDELDQWCLEHLARFKRPRAYVFMDRLPKNPTGKIIKTELRRLAAEA